MKNQLSLSILLVTVSLLLSSSLNAQESKTINIATAGTLPTLITKGEKDQITHLTLTGNLNGTDIRFIREMAGRNVNNEKTSGKLSVLDLSQANIVAGGGYFTDYTYITNDSLEIVHNTSGNIIDDHVFQRCTGLTEIFLPASITSIGKSAFEDCTGLTSLTIGNNVTSIGISAYRRCTGLTSLTIGKNVTSIGFGAFQFCKGLTSVLIPNSVTSIQNYAFGFCSGLTSVTIGSGVTSIGNSAFNPCPRLQKFRVSEENTSYCQLDGVLYSKDKTTLIACPNTKTNEYIIPNSVTSIGNGAFSSCRLLTSIMIPKSVTSIGDYAFSGCDGLTSITIPNSITSIGSGAFSNCDGLTSITIPKSVTSIGAYAFSRSSIKQIHCEALTPPSLGSSEPFTIDSDIKDELNAYYAFLKRCKIYVPKGTAAAYKTAEQWRKFSKIVEEKLQTK